MAQDIGGLKISKGNVMLAAKHFLGKSEAEKVDALKRTLEGHQRQILGTLTVEELFKDRAAFSARACKISAADSRSRASS